jgi:uncharacterized membrane protein YjgN (DUF898 family)
LSEQKTTKIVFNGKAGEYFGIWIVNLLLTLITLGIYSAWAKVRRKKYFYNNTLIDNVGFDYHAKPIAILKGRIIAFIFFIGYAFGAQIHPILPVLFMLLFFVGLPWLVVRSATFNARNTSHRGLRFDFVGKLGEAVRVYMLLPIITLFTLGLAAPFASHQKNKFLMSHHRFGLSQFDMQAKVKSFYKVYLFLILVPLILIVIGFIVGGVMRGQDLIKAKAINHAEITMPYAVGLVDTRASQPLSLTENTSSDFSQNDPEIVKDVAATDTVAIDDQPHEKTFEEMMKERQEARQKAMRDLILHPKRLIFVLVGLLVYAVFIFSFMAYIQARIGNLVWNNTTLDRLSFKSSLRARDFFWIYLSNIFAIVCTFGLATPWAQVRMIRYRTSKLQILGDVDFDQFVGDKKAEMKATGEEIADFFDVDLSLG